MADPVTLLAFANDQEGHRYLRDLPEELRQLQAIFETARRKGLCELVVRPNATLHQVFEAFTEYQDRVAIFHYGGHAGSDRLFLESPGTDGAVAHAEGLARFLGQRRNLELVFLNGCSTRAQAAGLLDAGIGAVISTARAIEDKFAREFAASFYAEIAAGATLLAAYEAARGRVQAAHGSVPRAYSRTRDLAAPSASTGEAEAESTDERGFPWELRFAPGAELERRWSLPEAAGNPLFGLPAPRVDCLPETPHRGLQPFTRRETAVFFGRSRAIRELYNLVTDPGTQPVILYYGPTGVGKSSVLAAGLLPRLELGHEVLYLRRDSNLGLLRTLRMGLAPGDRMDQPSTASELAELWRACERPDRPLVVVLDQAEEAFTHPAMGSHGRGPDSELEDLLEAVRVTFTGVDPARRPRGKLILGFRNDWLDRFQQAFNRIKLGWEPMPLKPLDHDGVVEAIEGPARDPALKRHYQLTIAPGLAPVIANDLLGDTGSALAPTLQFLLTKMWTRANVTDGPSFDQDLYRALQHEGYQLGDMLQEGLKAVSEEIRESGLALDVLEFHTTEFDTAARRSRAELDERYPHRKQELDNLLRTLEEKYLLIETEGRAEPSAPRVAATRLAHDTLAPVVRREFQESTAPGQRARRLLENRAREWKDGKTGHPLDAADLATVEAGAEGMRAWTKDEGRLVDASRQAESRRQAEAAERLKEMNEARERQRNAEAKEKQLTERRLHDQQRFNRRLRVLAGCLLGAAIFAGWFALDAYRESKKQTFSAFSVLCNSAELKKMPQKRLILSWEMKEFVDQYKWIPGWDDWVKKADSNLRDALDAIKGVSLLRQSDPVTALAVIPGQMIVTGSSTGWLRVWVWNPSGPEFVLAKRAHEDQEICRIAVSPGQKLLVSAGRDGELKSWRTDPTGNIIPEAKDLLSLKCRPTSLLFANEVTLVSSSIDEIHFRSLKDAKNPKWLPSPKLDEPTAGSRGEEITALALSGNGNPWVLYASTKVRNNEVGEVSNERGKPGFYTDQGKLYKWKSKPDNTWPKYEKSPPSKPAVFAMTMLGDGLAVGDGIGSIRKLDRNLIPGHLSIASGQGLLTQLVPDPRAENRFVTCGGNDCTVKVWNAETGKTLHVLPGHEEPITAAVFDEKGLLLTGSRDGSVRCWDLNKATARDEEPVTVDLVRKVAGRNLTEKEWEDCFPGIPYRRTFRDLPGGDGKTP